LRGVCWGMPIQVASHSIVDRANRNAALFKIVSPSYFSALRLQMIRGRPLSENDTKNAPPVIVINERLAKRDFPHEDPIGQRILIQEIVPGKHELGPEIPWEIVGIVHDEKVSGLDDNRSDVIYVSNEQSPMYIITLSVKTNVEPILLQNPIT